MPTDNNFIGEQDLDLVLGALANYALMLRSRNNGHGVNIYGKLIARTDALHRDLFRVRFGVDLPSKNEVN